MQAEMRAWRRDIHKHPELGFDQTRTAVVVADLRCYIMIDNGTDGHCGSSLHNPDYDMNDDILDIGCDYRVTLVQQQLPVG